MSEIFVNDDENDSGNGTVYFLQQGNDGPVKIGYSKNPDERKKTLETSNPEKLNMRIKIENASKGIEKKLHNKFDEYNIKGEWFRRDVVHMTKNIFFRGIIIPRIIINHLQNYTDENGKGLDEINEDKKQEVIYVIFSNYLNKFDIQNELKRLDENGVMSIFGPAINELCNEHEGEIHTLRDAKQLSKKTRFGVDECMYILLLLIEDIKERGDSSD